MVASSPLLAFLLVVALSSSLLFSVSDAQLPAFGAAVLRGSYLFPQALGYITFGQTAGVTSTSISITIVRGLPAGIYALHVHQYGDLTSGIGVSNISTGIVGSHFNPYISPHSCDPNGGYADKHVGDIGNLTVGNTLPVTLTFKSSLIDLSYSNSSIIGRAVILHDSYDHCVQPTGNAGTPIIAGVVGIGNPYLNPYYPSDLPTPTSTTTNAASLPLTYSNDANTSPNVNYGFSPTQSAVAVLYPNSSSLDTVQQAGGVVRFSPSTTTPGAMDVTITIRGLTPNSIHGFHVHLYGDDFDSSTPPYTPRAGSYEGSDHFANAGGHFNPYGNPHALPPNGTRHEGDLGNVTADGEGNVNEVKTSALLDVLMWNTSIIGRAVIVHLLPDTGAQPTGAAGDRLMAGIIGLSSLAGDASMKQDFTPFPITPGGGGGGGGGGSTASYMGSSSSTGDDVAADKEDDYIAAAVVIVLLIAVLVVVGMYVRFSYAKYDKPCFLCDCGGCMKHYCGGKTDAQAPYGAEEDGSATSGRYGAIRD